jgi:quercetin dioxygenase-like cupin family protein
MSKLASPKSVEPAYAALSRIHFAYRGSMKSTLDQPHPAHRRPHAPPMASPFLEFDLEAEVRQLRDEPTWKGGQNARTLMKYDDFRVVLTTLQATKRIPEHRTEGRISIHLLSGHVRLNASGRTFDLRPGSLVALDQGISHDIEALEDSAFLLTIAWPGRAGNDIGST